MTELEQAPPAGAADSLSPGLQALRKSFSEGERIALARAISVVENERPGFQAFLHETLAGRPPRGARIGITGPPGAGKSTLVTALARRCLALGDEVGVIAVDPTSPYSGGALLGDRIRMNELATEPGIFIRSMASRGSLGGLATTTKEVLDLMDAFGFPRLLVETVGVGQAELEITGAADTVVVVLVPESGDGIQAMKAGLMEIADIFVVNKADRPGADRLVREIRTALNLRAGKGMANVPAHHGVDHSRMASEGGGAGKADGGAGKADGGAGKADGGAGKADGGAGKADAGAGKADGPGNEDGAGKEDGPGKEDGAGKEGEASPWKPPIVLTTAHAGEGIEELLAEVDRHRSWMEGSGELEERRRRRTADRIRDVLDRELKRRVRRVLARSGLTDEAVARVVGGEATPYSVAGEFLARLGVDRDEGSIPG